MISFCWLCGVKFVVIVVMLVRNVLIEVLMIVCRIISCSSDCV